MPSKRQRVVSCDYWHRYSGPRSSVRYLGHSKIYVYLLYFLTIVWRIRGNVIIAVLCCTMYCIWAQL